MSKDTFFVIIFQLRENSKQCRFVLMGYSFWKKLCCATVVIIKRPGMLYIPLFNSSLSKETVKH